MKKGFGVKLLGLIFLMLINYGCDQQTKKIARTQLHENQRISYVNDMVHLQLAENTGAFLSSGSNLSEGWHTLLLKILPLLVLIGMSLYLLFSTTFNTGQFISLACVLGGGLSNVVDRIAWGSVTDFMILSAGKLHTGIFNTADLSITIGLLFFILFSFQAEPEDGKEEVQIESEING